MNHPPEPLSLEEKVGRKWTPLVFVGVILGLGLVWILGYRMTGSSAVQQLETKIKQSGQPLTLEDIAASYAVRPGVTNGADLLLREWEEVEPEFWRAFREGRQPLPTRREVHYDEALPFLSGETRRVSRTNALPATNQIAAEVYLEGIADHLDAVRAALRCSQFRFPVQITNGFSALLPHVAAMRREATNFRIEALLACERGDVDAALGSLEDAARTGKALVEEPFLISQLVRMSCSSMVLEELQRLLSRQPPSAAQLERVETLVNQMEVPGALRTALVCERVCDASTFRLPARQVFGWSGNNTFDELGFTAGMGAFTLLGVKAADHQLMLETLTEAIAVAEKSDPASLERLETLFREAVAKARRFPTRIFTLMIVSGLERVPARFTSFEARLRAARTALAVERYRMAHDRNLPERLDDLVPMFLKEVPKDPFDGNPLRYERRATGFVVYSIGNNRLDDGGKERLKQSSEDYDETFFIER